MAQEQLQIIINSQAKGKGAQEAKTGLDKLKDTVKKLALAYVSMKTVQAAIDFAKFGAAVQRQANALDGLAKSAGTSGDAIVKAIQGASDFTIDRMTAMEAANKAMLLDVAKSPEQFERLAKVATTLGRAMGQDAAKSIDDFVVAAGRQSKQIADNLGLMVTAEKANATYAQQLGKTSDELTDAERKQAFLNEMLVQGERKMAALGDDSGDTAAQFEILNAALKDAKADLGEMAAEAFASNVNLEKLAKTIREFPDRLREAQQAQAEFSEDLGEAEAYLYGDADAILRYSNEVDVFAIAAERGAAMNRAMAEAAATAEREERKHQMALARVPITVRDTVASYDEYQSRLGRMPRDQEALTETIYDSIDAFEEEQRKLSELEAYMFRGGMAFTDFYRRGREQAADFAEQREQIEADHQERLADLRAKGQASAIQIDAEAEEEKLATLKRRLEIALQQQAEFTDKTKESQRMAKETTIANLQTQIGKQEQLLSDFYGGRLIQQGQNISAELTAEQTRYDEELAMLEASRAEQEEEYRRSWGQILLQWFDGWAQMNQISSEKAMEMRIAIAEEYGLLDEAGARTMESMVAGWQAYADGSVESADVVIKQAEAVKAAVENLPTHKTITIEARVDEIIRRGGGWQEQFPGEEVAGPTPQESAVPREGETTPTTPGTRPRTPTPEAPSSPFEMQHGGYVPYGGLYSVGEAGRELVALLGGSYVFNATETAQMLNRAIGGRRALPAMAGGAMGGGNFSQVIQQTFIINGYDKSPRELAAEIKREERMSGGRIQV